MTNSHEADHLLYLAIRFSCFFVMSSRTQ